MTVCRHTSACPTCPCRRGGRTLGLSIPLKGRGEGGGWRGEEEGEWWGGGDEGEEDGWGGYSRQYGGGEGHYGVILIMATN